MLKSGTVRDSIVSIYRGGLVEGSKNGKSYSLHSSRPTLRDSILSLYGSSFNEDAHTFSTEETVEDLIDRAMTMLDEILNNESSLEPRDQFNLIDKTLDQAIDTVNNSKDLDIETKLYLKSDIEQKRKEVDYQRRVYLGDKELDALESRIYTLDDMEGDEPKIRKKETRTSGGRPAGHRRSNT